MLVRTTAALAAAFVMFAVYGASVIALVAAFGSDLLVLPNAVSVSVVVIAVSVFGLGHLAWTRRAPSLPLCLVLLVLEMACCSALLMAAVNGVSMTIKATEKAPTLTAYQQQIEAFVASVPHRPIDFYATVLRAAGVVSSPMRALTSDAYPLEAARAFAEAYCVSDRTCSDVPLIDTLLFSDVWPNENVMAGITRALSMNMTVTSTTTLERFCADVKLPPIVLETAARDHVTSFISDVSHLCAGCAALTKLSTSRLSAWIDATCPRTASFGAFCIDSAACMADGQTTGSGCASLVKSKYLHPAYDACFGRTLMLAARTSDATIVIGSMVLLLLSLLLTARLWVCIETHRRTSMGETRCSVQYSLDY
ncbi:hypothetical protein SDRG_07370 [Saprolegnia diclina VS20]|uniref:Uncharacterized protein n=1 Tax=Saprolegnia diclina (strain VS20) TaxID=1156394 RepID=T0RXR3_SAPDV|nr:hypothetical protein SDRG_07370 [Saprolegnia diclina VS20]EQC35137.1 hypothetical protein SDRG_07370 [Saprolegnia diclina VS20]|eukprot:XP_008611421.1 hypothetical protein SDRG_07370 [Saprolegnia diclina VS20]